MPVEEADHQRNALETKLLTLFLVLFSKGVFLSIKYEFADESVPATLNALISHIFAPSLSKTMCVESVFVWSLICELMKKSSLIRSNDGQTSKALELMFGSDKHPKGWPMIQAIQTLWVPNI